MRVYERLRNLQHYLYLLVRVRGAPRINGITIIFGEFETVDN